jgi:hypothetical protein
MTSPTGRHGHLQYTILRTEEDAGCVMMQPYLLRGRKPEDFEELVPSTWMDCTVTIRQVHQAKLGVPGGYRSIGDAVDIGLGKFAST